MDQHEEKELDRFLAEADEELNDVTDQELYDEGDEIVAYMQSRTTQLERVASAVSNSPDRLNVWHDALRSPLLSLRIEAAILFHHMGEDIRKHEGLIETLVTLLEDKELMVRQKAIEIIRDAKLADQPRNEMLAALHRIVTEDANGTSRMFGWQALAWAPARNVEVARAFEAIGNEKDEFVRRIAERSYEQWKTNGQQEVPTSTDEAVAPRRGWLDRLAEKVRDAFGKPLRELSTATHPNFAFGLAHDASEIEFNKMIFEDRDEDAGINFELKKSDNGEFELTCKATDEAWQNTIATVVFKEKESDVVCRTFVAMVKYHKTSHGSVRLTKEIGKPIFHPYGVEAASEEFDDELFIGDGSADVLVKQIAIAIPGQDERRREYEFAVWMKWLSELEEINPEFASEINERRQ